MDYSSIYFGKKLEELEYNDIIVYFKDEKEESNSIEFKSYTSEYGDFNKKIEGVIRGICAFLNSDGGILIWGAPEGQTVEGKKEKIFLGELSPVTEIKEKDWIINKVSDSITPLPIGIRVKLLIDTGHVVYIFEIQKSMYSPHQYKNIYFARLDGQSKPAPHYFIEALFRKITYPNIEAYIKIDKFSVSGNLYMLDISIIIFNFSELQNEENVTFRLMCEQGMFVRSENPDYQEMYGYDGHMLIFKQIDILHFGAPNIHHERIAINPHILSTTFNSKIELFLSFAGKKSPLKYSEYTIDATKLKFDNDGSQNSSYEKIEENILASQKQKTYLQTKEQILKSILER